jgi:phosphoglycerate dehydrogenase-like enzyme
MPKRLLIAADVDPELIQRMKADERFEVDVQVVRDVEGLRTTVSECEVLVTRSYNRVTADVIAAAPRLELIAQGTSGTDNVDKAALAERGIPLISLPGINADAVAELVLGFMISLTRTVPFYSRQMRSGVWARDDCATRHELRHYRLGIVGLGEVGRRVAALGTHLGMSVAAFDPYVTNEDFAARHAARRDSLQDLLGSSDILSLHVPLTEETNRLVGAEELAMLPGAAFVINTCRGEVLDLPAALHMLEANRLAGLAIDVYDPEPPSMEWPDDPRLLLTPHVAGCTHEAKATIGTRLYEQICQFYGFEPRAETRSFV